MAVRPSPEQLAAVWRAFRGERRGMMLGPGPGFAEAIAVALALKPGASVGEAERDAMARRLFSLHGCDLDDLRHARRHLDYILDGSGEGVREHPTGRSSAAGGGPSWS